MLFAMDEIKNRWQSYCTELFGGKGRTREDLEKGEEEPEVIEAEIEAAIKKLKIKKAVGVDEVPAETLKAGGVTVVKAMKSSIDAIWRTGEWP